MHARLFTSTAAPAPTDHITLGNVTEQVTRSKLPNGGGYFLYFNLNDHFRLGDEGARLIAERVQQSGWERPFFITPEASTMGMVQALRSHHGLEGLIIYKKPRLNDVDPVSVEYNTVTATQKNQLFLGKNKLAQLQGRDIYIVDSVCTTGGTIRGTYDLLLKAGIPAHRIKEATMLFTEGEPRNSLTMSTGVELPVRSFGHLPIIQEVTANHASESRPKF